MLIGRGSFRSLSLLVGSGDETHTITIYTRKIEIFPTGCAPHVDLINNIK